jgi:hypothetical protein
VKRVGWSLGSVRGSYLGKYPEGELGLKID